MTTSRLVLPARATYGAVDSFGGLVAGKYVPWLDACAVQLDVTCQGLHAELCFLETLLHELGAILASQHALARAAAALGDSVLRAEVRAYLPLSRRTTVYGDLADAVLRETRAPEVGWAIWRTIIALRRIPRQDYACRVLVPVLAGESVDALPCQPEERWIL